VTDPDTAVSRLAAVLGAMLIFAACGSEPPSPSHISPGISLVGFERRGWPLPQRVDRVYAIEKARQILGYQPRYGITEILCQGAA
jgi:hypothetical protein